MNPNDISTLPQMTNVQVDPFSNTVVQAGAAYGIGTFGLSYVPSTGNIFFGGGPGTPTDLGGFIGAGTTNNLDQAGFAVSASGFSPLGVRFIFEGPGAKATFIGGLRERGLDPHCGYPAPAPSVRLRRMSLVVRIREVRVGWWGLGRAGVGARVGKCPRGVGGWFRATG